MESSRHNEAKSVCVHARMCVCVRLAAHKETKVRPLSAFWSRPPYVVLQFKITSVIKIPATEDPRAPPAMFMYVPHYKHVSVGKAGVQWSQPGWKMHKP